MSLNGALSQTLNADAGVQAAHNGEHVYAQRAPHRAAQPAPFTVFQRIDGVPWNCAEGYGGTSRVRIQFDTYGETLADARAASQAIVTALRAAADKPLRHCIQLSDRDFDDESTDLHRVTMDWAFYVQE